MTNWWSCSGPTRSSTASGRIRLLARCEERDIRIAYPMVYGCLSRYGEWRPSMEQASVFRSNRSQAVRLPVPVALPDSVKKVDVIALGNARLLVPAGQAWDSWFDGEGVSRSEEHTSELQSPLN